MSRLQTKHNYEISYPYEWGKYLQLDIVLAACLIYVACTECAQCSKMYASLTICCDAVTNTYCRYGRFSKSIRPDECGMFSNVTV